MIMRTFVRNLGFDIIKYPYKNLKNRMKLFKHYQINMIFDVGANIGQYATSLRSSGYNEYITSFEPIFIAYQKMQNNFRNDSKWKGEHFALGNFDGVSEINISDNLVSSSILEITDTHIDSAPTSVYSKKEKIQVYKLDTIIDKYDLSDSNLFVKIDTQGFEKQVIEGAEKSLSKIKGFQVELSLTELYQGEALFKEMLDLLNSKGYNLYYLDPGYAHSETGRLLQVDGIFFRD